MATVTGKLQDVLQAIEDGSVEIALCGYGGRVPRKNGVALYGSATSDEVDVKADGTFNLIVAGNDEIAPAGTYYTVTVKDNNGDVVQVNAYRFLGNTSYDLNLIDPYDPSQPPPPLPPVITNQLLILPATVPMNFPGDTYTTFKVTLPGDVPQTTISGMVPGNLYTFIIVQDGTGNHLFTWPPGVHNATRVCPTPNFTTVQTFVADDRSELWAIGPGTWSA